MDNIDRQAERMFSIIGQETGEHIKYGREPGDLPVPERNVVKLADNIHPEVESVELEGVATEDIETQLAAAVDDITDAMTTLRSELLVGAPPRSYEVYTQLATARVSALDSMLKIRMGKQRVKQDERKTKVAERKQELAEQKLKAGNKPLGVVDEGKGTIPMTGRQILELARTAVDMHEKSRAEVKPAEVVEEASIVPKGSAADAIASLKD